MDDSHREPSPTQPCGLGPPSPAEQERGFMLVSCSPSPAIAGEGAERSEAGEGVLVPSVRFLPLD